MEWQQVLDTLAALSPEDRNAWLRVSGGIAVVVALLLWLECRVAARNGRTGSWLTVRVVSLFALPVTLAVLIMPARAVGGMEGLAAFYLALFTVAPLVWFGSHIFTGRHVRPAFSGTESFALACSALAILAIPATALLIAQDALYAASREIGSRTSVPADNPPLQHTPGPVVGHTLPGVGLVYTQTLTGARDIRLLGVEQRQWGQWPTAPTYAHPAFCTHGNDVHLMWSAREPAPYLRLRWAQSFGVVVRAEYTPEVAPAAAADARAFSVAFRDDGLDPVAPIPRERVHLVLKKGEGAGWTQMLGNPPEAGEVRMTDCILAGFERWPPNDSWKLQAVGIMFYLPTGGAPLRALLERGQP